MVIFLRIEVQQTFQRPGIRIAQILRYITPVIETMVPLKNGSVPDRMDPNATLAEWTVVEATKDNPEPRIKVMAH